MAQPEISILYVTERILVLTFPSGEDDIAYKSSLRHVSRMLKTKHDRNYKIFNLSQKRRDLAALNPGLLEFGWPEDLSPPLERLCSICKEIDNWITTDKRHLVVLHENGGACRSAVVVACFMHYQQICANEDLALDRFAMRKFFNEQRVLPSQKRYVNYFAGLLTTEIRINSNPIYLYQVVIYGIPRTAGLYLKIYEKMTPVYLSPVYKATAPILTIKLNPVVCLRGDIIFKCFEHTQHQLMFRCQFNTCAVDVVSSSCFSFTSRELDDISYEDAGLDLLFSFSRDVPTFGEASMTMPAEVEPNGSEDQFLNRSNSYEHFESYTEDDDATGTANLAETNGASFVPTGAISGREREHSANDTADSGIQSVVDFDNEQQLLENVEIQNQSKRANVVSLADQQQQRLNGEKTPTPKIERKLRHERDPEEVVMSATVGGRDIGGGNRGATAAAAAAAAEENGPIEFPHRPPPVTPPSKRTFSPLMRPISPAVVDDARIDPELVATDRYDPQSRAFSYVPVQSLQDHFRAPKKPTQLVQKIERATRSTPSSPPPGGELFHQSTTPTGTVKSKSNSIQGPLSTSDIDQLLDPDFYLNYTDEDAANGTATPGPSSSLGYREPPPPPQQQQQQQQQRFSADHQQPSFTKKVPPPVHAKPSRPLNAAEENLLRDLQDYDPRNSVPPSPRQHQQQQQQQQYQQQQHPATPQSSYQPRPITPLERQDWSSPLAPIVTSEAALPPVSELVPTPSPPRKAYRREPRWDEVINEPQYGPRPSPPRSQASQAMPSRPKVAPMQHNQFAPVRLESPLIMTGKLSADDDFMVGKPVRYPAAFTEDHHHDSPLVKRQGVDVAPLSDFEPIYTRPLVKKTRSVPDDYLQSSAPWLDAEPNARFDPWLESQMEKLRLRRELNDPDLQRRREQERLLLEELKHVHDEKMIRTNRREEDYAVEGYGLRGEEGVPAPVVPTPLYGRRAVIEEPSPAAAAAAAATTTMMMPLPREEPAGPDLERLLMQREELRRQGYLVLNRQIITNPMDLPPKTLLSRQWSDSMIPTGPAQSSSYYHHGYNNGVGDYSRTLSNTSAISPDYREVNPVTSSPASVGQPLSYNNRSYSRNADPISATINPITWRSPSAPPDGPTDFSRLQDILWDADQYRTSNVNTPTPSLSKVSSPKSILKKPKSVDAQTSTSSVPGRYFNGYRENESLPHSRVFELETAQPPAPFLQSDTFDSITTTSTQASSYRPETPSSAVTPYRAETPAFPVRRAETPLPYHPLLYSGAGGADDPSKGRSSAGGGGLLVRSPSPASQYYGHSRRSSVTSLLEPMEIVHQHPVFVKDTSKYWYKPAITRDDAINILKDKPPGTFIIRDSNSFPGAFGLALKVATPPPGVQTKSNDGSELVRHFLIEPTAKGVKLKGCNNEPVFGSLAALVYQHSITPLALPCKLLLPDYDPAMSSDHINAAQALLEQGAACNVTYLFSCDTESLTGPEAVRRAVDQALVMAQQKQLAPVSVHFKVAGQGITITDNTRKLFFRRHYPVNSVTFCGVDPEDRRWSSTSTSQPARIFGFVARKIANKTENACHIFAELEPEQPATAIVNFVTKVMMAPLHSIGTTHSSSTLK